jgi:hypothetical protein
MTLSSVSLQGVYDGFPLLDGTAAMAVVSLPDAYRSITGHHLTM